MKQTNPKQKKPLVLIISFICIYQICQAKFPEDRKISLMCLTTPLICTRTQNLIIQQQMYCIKSTAERPGFFWQKKADTDLLGKGEGGKQ